MVTADRYCDLAGIDTTDRQPMFFAHDASVCTLIEVDGTRTILSPQEYVDALLRELVGGIAQVLKKPGHQLSVSFESSMQTRAEIDDFVAMQRRHAAQKDLDVDTLIDEGRAVLERGARYEKILFAVWTRRNAGIPADVAQEYSEKRRAWRGWPQAREAQSPYLHLSALDGPHNSFVGIVIKALKEAGLQARILGVEEDGARRDLEEIRRCVLFHETPDGWSPAGPGLRRFPADKEKHDVDVSGFFTPTVARQIMTSNATASSDLRTVEYGGRRYGIVTMRMFPAELQPFNRLIQSLSDSDGDPPRIPFRICWHFEALRGGVELQLRKVLAGLLGKAARANANLFRAIEDLQGLMGEDNEAVVKTRLVATTWTEPGEDPSLLEIRRSRLTQGLMTWGDAVVSDAPANPLRSLCETVPGLTVQCTATPAAIGPLGDLSTILPFHRPAPVFEQGQTAFLSSSGRMLLHEAHSREQLYWLTLILASSGSGKSVLMNQLNLHFSAFTAGRELPFLAVIDVGISSAAIVNLLRSALPPARRQEAVYTRLQNDRTHAINPLDIELGSRGPLPRERVFIENFLVALLGVEDPEFPQLVAKLVETVFTQASDATGASFTKVYQPGIDAIVDEAVRALGITTTDRTRWWWIVDDLAEFNSEAALRAQRYAVPVLHDLAPILGRMQLDGEYPDELLERARRALEVAIDRYPMFAQPTRLDLGEARVVAIDLNDVIDRNRTVLSARNNALMFMIARHIFISKISGHHEEFPALKLPDRVRDRYRSYYQTRYTQIGDTPKRLAMDEFHWTGGLDTIAQQVVADAREGRKWGLEITLASQLLSDFDTLKSIASTVIVMNPDAADLREAARRTFGFSDAVMSALEREVRSPAGSRGSSFLVRFKLREEERWVVMSNPLGPRMMWALSTTPQDMQVRDELYRRLPVSEALRVLSRRFPLGSAVDQWKRFASTMPAGEKRIAEVMVDRIMAEMMGERDFFHNEEAR